MRLTQDILTFLTANGFECKIESVCGSEFICVSNNEGLKRIVLPISISAANPEDAQTQSADLQETIRTLTELSSCKMLLITEDRWRRQRSMMEARLLAHLEVFFPVYARNCEIRKIDKAEAAAFLQTNHSYGDAACRYRYGIFLKRHTGWRSLDSASCLVREDKESLTPGTLVAVAEFSNARKWVKGDKTIRSYEWTRYASLPGVRINGGMGKMLKHFIKEVQPDDIMSYADLEWSEGAVYEQLGFTLEDRKEPVAFTVDCNTWARKAIRTSGEVADEEKTAQSEARRFFRNFGSNKYRLKLTEYR